MTCEHDSTTLRLHDSLRARDGAAAVWSNP